MKKAIFIDKDGTLVDDIPYNVDPDRIRLSANSMAGLRQLMTEGYLLIMITNQSGVAKGYFSENQLRRSHRQLERLLHEQGVRLDAWYYCPHHPDGDSPYDIECDCRKPKPGMLLRAASLHDIDLKRSWMIGDILNDVEAGNRAGCRTILIDNGNETEWVSSPYRLPNAVVKSIDEAAAWILKDEQVIV